MSELARLKERLFSDPTRTLVNFSFTPGPKATPETVAREINKALDAIERGDFDDQPPHSGRPATRLV